MHSAQDSQPPNRQALERECRLFTAYLIARTPPEEIVERYARANGILLNEPGHSLRVVDFVMRNPWSLPFLDAACGLLRSDDLLRKKLLTLLAILEATPAFTSHFLPPPARGVAPLAVELVWNGTMGAVKCAVGILLWPLVQRG